MAIAACSPPAPEPTPPPRAAPRPAPAPAPTVAATPRYDNWLDAPQTPGDWRYAAGQGGTRAQFGPPGTPVFSMGCNAASRQVILLRHGNFAAGDYPLIIRTETTDRTLAARSTGDGATTVALQARDPLLDAMAFTKGRFAVEVQGQPPLYVPAWAEVTRIIEDCR